MPTFPSIQKTAIPPHIPSNILDPPMKRTPNAPDPLILTDHILPPDLAILQAGILHQQLRLLHDLLLLQIPHAHGLLLAVDVVGAQDGVLVRPRRDVDAERWVGAGEGREEAGGEEGAERREV